MSIFDGFQQLSKHLPGTAPRSVSLITGLTLLMMSCSDPSLQLGPCWNVDKLRQGQKLSGKVKLLASNVVPTMMSPLSCGGKILIVKIPKGSLPMPSDSQQEAPYKADYSADIEGVVDGMEQGRPKVLISKVTNVRLIS